LQCAGVVDQDFGIHVHVNFVKRGLLCLVYVNNSLVDMYCKCGLFDVQPTFSIAHVIELFREMC